MQQADRKMLQSGDVAVLLLEGQRGQSEDFDKTHGDVEACICAVASRGLMWMFICAGYEDIRHIRIIKSEAPVSLHTSIRPWNPSRQVCPVITTNTTRLIINVNDTPKPPMS